MKNTSKSILDKIYEVAEKDPANAIQMLVTYLERKENEVPEQQINLLNAKSTMKCSLCNTDVGGGDFVENGGICDSCKRKRKRKADESGV